MIVHDSEIETQTNRRSRPRERNEVNRDSFLACHCQPKPCFYGVGLFRGRRSLIVLLAVFSLALQSGAAKGDLLVIFKGNGISYANEAFSTERQSIVLVTKYQISSSLIAQITVAFRNGIDVRVVVRSSKLAEFYRSFDLPVYENKQCSEADWQKVNGLWFGYRTRIDDCGLMTSTAPGYSGTITIDDLDFYRERAKRLLQHIGQFSSHETP